MHDKIAHTAEHAFIGSLQRLLGATLHVRKVEHKVSENTAIIAMPNLDQETVLKAELEVNALIREGRRILERRFDSLDSAKKEIPHLRANDERIAGQVRVVEIEGHDSAACAMEHAENLQECDFFLVTRISKSGNECEVDFRVGKDAKETAISLVASLLRVCSELGANINTVEKTAKKLKAENEANHAKLKSLGREKLESMREKEIGHYSVFTGVFSNLADDQLHEFAGEKISRAEDAVVLLANSDAGSEMASIVFARNEKIREIDCNALFKRFSAETGRGGGKSHFVTGVMRKDHLDGFVADILDEIAKISSKF